MTATKADHYRTTSQYRHCHRYCCMQRFCDILTCRHPRGFIVFHCLCRIVTTSDELRCRLSIIVLESCVLAWHHESAISVLELAT